MQRRTAFTSVLHRFPQHEYCIETRNRVSITTQLCGRSIQLRNSLNTTEGQPETRVRSENRRISQGACCGKESYREYGTIQSDAPRGTTPAEHVGPDPFHHCRLATVFRDMSALGKLTHLFRLRRQNVCRACSGTEHDLKACARWNNERRRLIVKGCKHTTLADVAQFAVIHVNV